MRSFILLFLLVPLLVTASACSSGATALTGEPPVSVTPATGPIGIPGVTPPKPDDPTPVPLRTPIRLKVPATPPLYLTETPVAQPSPEPKATVVVVVSADTEQTDPPTSTPNFITATPTDTPEGMATVAEPDEHEPAVALPQGLDNTLNILVVGSDERRSGVPWRSDVIMIAAVDFESRQVGVLSLPRDLWVEIPTVGDNRINTATFWGELNRYPDGGGIGLLKETIARNFGIRIDHHIKFSFDSFKDIVDALGGVDITVQCAITGNFPREPGSSQRVWKTLEPDEYHMDGFFALLYARQRKTTSDIDRTRRQQQLMVAMRKRAREVNIIPRLPALYDALQGTIETDLGLTDIIALSRLALQIDPRSAHGYSIGFKETRSWRTPAGAAVLLPRWEKIQEKIEHLFEQPTILKDPGKPANCR